MVEFSGSLADDRSLVALAMPTDIQLSPEDLEEFIRALGRIRADMSPAVTENVLKPGTKISIVPIGAWHVQADPNAPTAVRIYLKHLGFGWISMSLNASQIGALTEALQTQLEHLPLLM
jgi:hypothetical protein